MNNLLKQKLQSMPQSPGCYLWKDEHGEILYIGKAKNLKQRTNQYFNKHLNTKTQKLVSKIADLDYIVVNSENEALILENNLIKKYKPYYNILLKEGSNIYPFIALTKEPNPRLIYTKNLNLKAKYYGPFANTKDFNAYELYLLLNRLFPLRKCNKIPKKPCMYYYMNQCLGPCINNVSTQEYEQIEQDIDKIFNHKAHDIIKKLQEQEKHYAKELAFEQAQMCYDYAQQLKSISERQLVLVKEQFNTDFIGYYQDQDNNLCIMIFNFIDGKLLSKHQYITEVYDDINEVIISYLVQYYQENQMKPKQIYLSLDNENAQLLERVIGIKIINPKKGEKQMILLSAIQNAKEYYLKHKDKQDDIYQRTIGAQISLQSLLNMDKLETIEMIDNSNIFLEQPVSAVVHFANGVANKQKYRKYNLHTTINKSDYYFMQEVIIRKYAKANAILPDLLILDGAKSQISAAKEIIQNLNLAKPIKIVGLVKNKKHRTEALMDEEFKLYSLEPTSYLYRFLAHIQDEAHRFAISFHRSKRDSKISTFLDDVPGLGTKSKQKIIAIYPNIYDLKNVNIETLEQIIPKKVAINLMNKIKGELK